MVSEIRAAIDFLWKKLKEEGWDYEIIFFDVEVYFIHVGEWWDSLEGKLLYNLIFRQPGDAEWDKLEFFCTLDESGKIFEEVEGGPPDDLPVDWKFADQGTCELNGNLTRELYGDGDYSDWTDQTF